jgi:outer membrane biogenesis lipoprotein LolB
MTDYRALTLLLCALLLAACSEEPAAEKPKEQGGHVWQGQVDMLNEAKQVGQQANEYQLQKEERLKERE